MSSSSKRLSSALWCCSCMRTKPPLPTTTTTTTQQHRLKPVVHSVCSTHSAKHRSDYSPYYRHHSYYYYFVRYSDCWWRRLRKNHYDDCLRPQSMRKRSTNFAVTHSFDFAKNYCDRWSWSWTNFAVSCKRFDWLQRSYGSDVCSRNGMRIRYVRRTRDV